MILDTLGDEILKEAEGLVDGDIVLTPGSLPEDIGLVMKFAMGDRYNQTPEPQLVKGLEFVKYLWIGEANGVIGGVLMLCWLENLQCWTLDAYKNSEHDNTLGDYSYRSGRLVIDWFFRNVDAKELRTMHRTDNKLATKVCQRLGFEITHKLGDAFVMMTLEREFYGN